MVGRFLPILRLKFRIIRSRKRPERLGTKGICRHISNYNGRHVGSRTRYASGVKKEVAMAKELGKTRFRSLDTPTGLGRP